MFSRILNYGLIAGLLAGVPLSVIVVAFHDHTPEPYGMVIGYAIMLVALTMVFVAIKRHRDIDLGGVIGFWRALAVGLGVSFVAGVLYAVTWDAALAITGADFIGAYAKSLIAQKQAAGVTGEALAKFITEMEDLKRLYANPLFRLPMTFIEIFPVGVLVSLISAALLRNSRFLPARRG
jgi:hypothetical protein